MASSCPNYSQVQLEVKIPAGCIGKVKAKHQFTSTDSKCISFKKGDLLYVLKEDKSGWWNGSVDGERGWFPSNFCRSVGLSEWELNVIREAEDRGIKFGSIIDVESLALSGKLRDDKTANSLTQQDYPVNGSAPSRTGSADSGRLARQRSSAETLPRINTSTLDGAEVVPTASAGGLPTSGAVNGSTPRGQLSLSSPTTQSSGGLSSQEQIGRARAGTNTRSRESIRARRPSVSGWTVELSTLINPATEKVTWNIVVNNILNAIAKLNQAAKLGEKRLFIPQTNTVAQAIRDMLLCAGLVDSESPLFQKHKILRSHHHNILKSLSKMMLSAKLASGIWPPPEAINNLRFQAGQLLLAIRQFVAAAQESNMELCGDISSLGTQPDGTAPWQLNNVTEFDAFGVTLSDDEFVAKLDQYSEETGAATASLLKLLEGPINTEALLSQSRILVSNIGQLLSLIDDIHVEGVEHEQQSVTGNLDSMEDKLQDGEQRARLHYAATRSLMFNTTNEFMSLVQLTLEPYAPANCVIQLSETTKELLRCTESLTMATKLVMDQHDLFVLQSLQDTVNLLEEASKRDSDLVQLQRRAMSLTFADANSNQLFQGSSFEENCSKQQGVSESARTAGPARDSLSLSSASTPGQLFKPDSPNHSKDAGVQLHPTSSDSAIYTVQPKTANSIAFTHRVSNVAADSAAHWVNSSVKAESKLAGPSLIRQSSSNSMESLKSQNSLSSSSSSTRRKVASVGDLPIQFQPGSQLATNLLGSAESLARSISSIPEQESKEPTSGKVRQGAEALLKEKVTTVDGGAGAATERQTYLQPHLREPTHLSRQVQREKPQVPFKGLNSAKSSTGHSAPQQQPQSLTWERTQMSATSPDLLAKMMSSLGEDKLGSLSRRVPFAVQPVALDGENKAKEAGQSFSLLSHDYEPWEVAYNEHGQVVGATKSALVELLTSHESKPDEEFLKTFLYTFRLFMSPGEFIDALRSRFFLGPPADQSLLLKWREVKQAPVRLRSWYALRLWLENYWFEPEDGQFVGKLILLAEDLSSAQVSHATRLQEILEQKFAACDKLSSKPPSIVSDSTNPLGDSHLSTNGDKNLAAGKISSNALQPQSTSRRRFTSLSNPFSHSNGASTSAPFAQYSSTNLNSGHPSSAISSFDYSLTASNLGASIAAGGSNNGINAYSPSMSLKELNAISSVTEIDASEMARQITLVDYKLFQSIRPAEFLRQEWTKKNTTVAVNIAATIKFSTLLSEWIIQLVLHESDSKKRGLLIKYFIKLADRLRQIRNFNSVMAIVSALNAAPISRLRKSWEAVSSKYRSIFANLRTLMDHSRNFAVYRQTIKVTGLPCLPFLGLFLTDLVFMNEGNPNLRNGERHLNFDKYRKMTKLVFEQGVGHYQQNAHGNNIYGPNDIHQQIPLFYRLLYTTDGHADELPPNTLVIEGTDEPLSTAGAGYQFAPIRQILLFLYSQLERLTSYSGEYLYQLSLEREPREEQPSPNSGSQSANPNTPSVSSRGRGHSIISFSSLLHSESSTLPASSP